MFNRSKRHGAVPVISFLLIFSLLILSLPAALFIFPAAASEGAVYYNPDGGRYYHSRPDCETIRSEYHPKMQALSPSRLGEEPFSTLTRCSHCFVAATPAPPAADAADWVKVVYYNPDGGHYYHLRADCETIRSEYRPLLETLNIDRIGLPAYAHLSRCNHCFAEAAEPDRVTYFRHNSVYDVAPEGLVLGEGVHIVGADCPAGVYTLRAPGGENCEAYLFAENGDILRSFRFEKAGSASFYLAPGMSIRLPAGCEMAKVAREARFQSVYEKTEIFNDRYFVMVECPGLQYWVQAMEGKEGYAAIYSMDAECGLAEPVITELSGSEPVLINLQGGYDSFVELRNCVIWPAEAGEG